MRGADFVEHLKSISQRSPGEREVEREARMFATRRALAPVLEHLASVGVHIKSLDQLAAEHTVDRKRAVPLLLEGLVSIENADAKEAIVRALTDRSTPSSVAGRLIEEFVRLSDEGTDALRWAIGNALAVIADDSVLDSLVDLVCNRRYGQSREMLAIALGRMKGERAVEVLVTLLDDPQVAGHAIMALGKLRAKRARPRVEGFLNHEKTWIRREAKKALARISRWKGVQGE